MKYFICYKRSGAEWHVELFGAKEPLEALNMAVGFVTAAVSRHEPFEFVSVYVKADAAAA